MVFFEEKPLCKVLLSCAFKYLDLKKKIKQGGVVRDSYINTN